MAQNNKTSKDLARRVLQELGVLDGQDTPNGVDVGTVEEIYKEKLAELESENIADWPFNRIPEAAMPGLVMVMSFACADSFRVQYAETKDQRGYYLLRKYTRIRPQGDVIEGHYF